MTTHANWFQTFFDGLAVELWSEVVKIMPTAAEVDYIEKNLSLTRGAKVLDVPCGSGRHSVELARRGFDVVGVDLSRETIEAARKAAKDAGAPVDFRLADMREISGSFDAAICMGNSFGYLPHPEMARFNAALHGALKPGGRFLLQLGCVAESLLPNFREEATYTVGEVVMKIHNTYDVAASALQTEYTFTKNGRVEIKAGWQSIYSSGEFCRMFESAGFEIVRMDQSVSGEPYALKAQQLFLIARRV